MYFVINYIDCLPDNIILRISRDNAGRDALEKNGGGLGGFFPPV